MRYSGIHDRSSCHTKLFSTFIVCTAKLWDSLPASANLTYDQQQPSLLFFTTITSAKTLTTELQLKFRSLLKDNVVVAIKISLKLNGIPSNVYILFVSHGLRHYACLGPQVEYELAPVHSHSFCLLVYLRFYLN